MQHLASSDKIYEYIVVGTGPGGSVVASELQSRGADVLMVEAGPMLRKDSFPKTEADASARLYWGGGIDIEKQARTFFLRGRVVGGSSILYQSLFDRFDDLAFSDWKTQSGVADFTSEAMSPHYDFVEQRLDTHTYTKGEQNGNARLFTDACDRLSYRWHHLRRGQNDCAHERGNDCIGCLSGCFRDSKQSSLVAFIQPAEKQVLRVLADTTVEYISPGPTIQLHCDHKGEKQLLQCRHLILSAGSFGSTGVLLRSGLAAGLPALGKYFSCHPQYMSFGIFDGEVNSHKGYFQTVASDEPAFRKAGFKLENVFAPPISIAMLFREYGADHHKIMRDYNRMACIEVAIRDENSGRIELDKKGKLQVTKTMTDQDKNRGSQGLEVIRNIFKTAGAREILQPSTWFGLHLMGGCSMGEDSANSVVGPDHRLHGHDNIFVCDSSLFPNAPGINPSLTIYALSHRLSTQMT